MALTWELKDIENWETVTQVKIGEDEYKLNPVTESLIWYAMIVGFNTITTRNARDIAIRIDMYEQGTCPMLVDRKITYKDVRQHIGLRTNCGDMTAAEFKKKLWSRMLDESTRYVDRQIEELKSQPPEGTTP